MGVCKLHKHATHVQRIMWNILAENELGDTRTKGSCQNRPVLQELSCGVLFKNTHTLEKSYHDRYGNLLHVNTTQQKYGLTETKQQTGFKMGNLVGICCNCHYTRLQQNTHILSKKAFRVVFVSIGITFMRYYKTPNLKYRTRSQI